MGRQRTEKDPSVVAHHEQHEDVGEAQLDSVHDGTNRMLVHARTEEGRRFGDGISPRQDEAGDRPRRDSPEGCGVQYFALERVLREGLLGEGLAAIVGDADAAVVLARQAAEPLESDGHEEELYGGGAQTR